MNILIVDDEILEAEIIQKLIDRKRFPYSAVYVAQNMEEAMGILRKYPVSVILCDIEMPQGSGLDLTHWIRENEVEAEVIYLTGHAEFSYATEALRLGAVDYLLKPVEQEDLMRALEKAARNIPDFKGVTGRFPGRRWRSSFLSIRIICRTFLKSGQGSLSRTLS